MPPRQRAQMVKRPTVADDGARDQTVADAAVAEVIDPRKEIAVEFDDHIYRYKRKRLESVQFRLRLQKNHDAEAMEWLLGPIQFAEFLDRSADEDGCTDPDTYTGFIDALFEGVGAGNSSRSSR